MTEISYKTGEPKIFSDTDKKVFVSLLKLQGKMRNPTIVKVNACKLLCVCKDENKIVSIGAIKLKTNQDFDSNKSDLDELRSEFDFELGYCFTLEKNTGKGYSSTIVKLLLEEMKGQNLMASTELKEDNSMKRILQRNGFERYGKPWKSTIHGGILGLYLKFVK